MRKTRAFTLIELLVVVAIIAVLLAMLIPTLATARAQAKSTQCLAKLHALGIGAAEYNADWGVICYEYYWQQALFTYITGRADPAALDQATKDAYKMFRCPVEMIPITADKPCMYAGNNNVFSLGDSIPFSSPPPANAILSNNKRAGETIAFGDANQAFGHGGSWWVFDWTQGDMTGRWGLSSPVQPDAVVPAMPGNVDFILPSGPGPSATGLRYRHSYPVTKTNGTANVVFFDWHAEGIKIGNLRARNVLISQFQ